MINDFWVTHEAICQWFSHDFVTHENYWQIASLVIQKSLFTITHALYFICHWSDFTPVSGRSSWNSCRFFTSPIWIARQSAGRLRKWCRAQERHTKRPTLFPCSLSACLLSSSAMLVRCGSPLQHHMVSTARLPLRLQANSVRNPWQQSNLFSDVTCQYQQLHSFFNNLSKLTTKQLSKLHINDLLWGDSTIKGQ